MSSFFHSQKCINKPIGQWLQIVINQKPNRKQNQYNLKLTVFEKLNIHNNIVT